MRKQKKDQEAKEYEDAARKHLSKLKETGPHSPEIKAEVEALEKLLPPEER